MPFSPRDKTWNEICWAFLTKGSTLVLFVCANIVLARNLDVDAFGQWSYLLSILTTLLTLGHFGINASSRIFVARHGDTQSIGSILKEACILRLKTSALFCLAFLMCLILYGALFGVRDFHPLLLISIPFIFFKTIVEFFKEIFQGLRRGRLQFFINSSEYAVYLLLLVAFLRQDPSISLIIGILSISTLLAAAVGAVLFYGIYKSNKNTREREAFQRDMLLFALPFILTGLGFALITEVDTVMLGLMSSKTEIAFYSAAKSIINKLPHIALALSVALMPVFAVMDDGNRSILKKKFYYILKLNSVIYVPIVLISLFFGGHLISFMFGDGYLAAVLPLQILSVWLLMVSFNAFQSSFLDYQKRAWKRSLHFGVTVFLTIALNFLLIPKYGAVGASLATTIAYIPYFLFNLVEVRKAFGSAADVS